MFDISAGKKIGEALQWLIDLGESDTKHIRQETEELLIHCSATLRSLVELNEALHSLKKNNFDRDSFLTVYFHCIYNYTNPEAAIKARTHCSDIQRDINRINFKITKILRTDIGKWSDVESGFKDLMNADLDFLDRFEVDMKLLTERLDKAASLIADDRIEEAWNEYEALKAPFFDGASQLRAEIETMKRADSKIRGFLT